MSIDAMFQAAPAAARKDEAPTEIPRDRWQRPLIQPVDGGNTIPYLRASTIAGVLDDNTNLGTWKARMTGRGVAISPDLQAGFSSIQDMESKEGKKTANELAEQAQERARASSKRVVGTAFHSLTEAHDRGQAPDYIPPELHDLYTNYVRETMDVEWLAIERFIIADEVRSAGTTDRVGRRAGQKPRIWDVKTGRVDFGALRFAIQLAIYAHGVLYNPETHARKPWPDIDLEVAHICHADPQTGIVRVHDVDIAKGWEAAQVARVVYDFRRDRKIMVLNNDEPIVLPAAEPASGKTIMQRLTACTVLDDLNVIFAETGQHWEDRHKRMAGQMAKEIRERSA